MSAAAGTVRGGRAKARPRLRATLTGWGFTSPFLILFGVFMLVPILASFALAFTSFGIGNIQSWGTAEFVGFENFSKLFEDDLFLKSVRNTAYFVVVGVPLTVIGSLLLATALNQGIGKLRGFFRVGYYLPVVTSIVAIAVIWRYVLEPDVGLINTVLGKVGIEGPNWLGNPNTTMPSIIAVGVWRSLGFSMVIFLAALQTIDPQLHDAAKVDGAKPRQIFRHITVPLLRPAILFVTVVTSIGFLQVFEEPFVMTGPTGGTQQSAFTTSMYVYQEGFRFFNLGYASAVAYALFVAIVVLAILQFRFLRSET